MSFAQFLTLCYAVASILPTIITMVREGQIKEGAYEEVLKAISDDFDKRMAEVAAAKPTGGEADDPYNRTR